MATKHKLRSGIIHILKHNRDGSAATQDNRRTGLLHVADELIQMGIKIEHPRYLRERHVKRLFEKWKNDGREAATLKNRASHLRWLCRKLDKTTTIPSNDALGIPKRTYIANIDKSRTLSDENLKLVRNERAQLSLRAQRLFGLRVEESLKIQPYVADLGDHLYLKASWTKGGRERVIPIQTEEQRIWLEDAKLFVLNKTESLIPPDTSYITYRRRFDKQTETAGITKKHGLRHLYAQERYKEIAGFECPVKGGPKQKDLSPEQRRRDFAARMIVSNLLGHSRLQISAAYLGK